MSEKNRLATLLFYRDRLSLQEVADRLNISIAAVKGRLHKSRHQLRSKLSPLQFPLPSTSIQESQPMNANTSEPAKLEMYCSFCQKSHESIKFLIAGPILRKVPIYICNECVDICNNIIREQERVDRQNS
ncbi:hypothetical protein C7B77_01060 [Chamaesiphon polymorphus CCALA 037]|uniref:ClpX-type ZB domain-containing protein n=1 Tax=Chamaesiphon polymorphus CCALA 037 TaxID=2107692 RepID=A0A2T1GN79_9CYAN|nr:hypothetical protein C7B77_01060 [Chamaesiphon polymorphus CCALA 037]